MAISYWSVLLCAVLSMVLGGLWYGPLFGKKWMEIIGATASDMKRRKEMQKSAGPLYAVQFFLTIFQAYVLAMFLNYMIDAPGADSSPIFWSLLICAGFVLPTVAAGAMWNNDSAKISWARFLIQTGYQVILFIIFGWILG